MCVRQSVADGTAPITRPLCPSALIAWKIASKTLRPRPGKRIAPTRIASPSKTAAPMMIPRSWPPVLAIRATAFPAAMSVTMVPPMVSKNAAIFPWEEGDLLMVDNVLTSHGRSAYNGPRKIIVGMIE